MKAMKEKARAIMRNAGQHAAFWLNLSACLCLTACGGMTNSVSTGGGVGTSITPTVTVSASPSSITTAESMTVTVSVSSESGTPTGTVRLSSGGMSLGSGTLSGGSVQFTIAAGTLAAGIDALAAFYTPDSNSSSTYNSSSGISAVTVTATTTPAVTVSANPSSITTAQSTTVTVTVSGSSGTPTGSVTLSSGTYSSGAVTLIAGSAQITIPAGSLASGTDTLAAEYTSSETSTYNDASGTASVIVSAAPTLITPTVAVSPNPSSISTADMALGQSIPYSCVGSMGPGGSDALNITALFASSGAGAQVDLSGQNCTANSTIVWGSQQSLNIGNATLTCNLSAGPCTANTSYLTPATNSFTCALTAGSKSATCTSASFSAANDVNESFYCPDALPSTADFHTSIALVNSGTSITLADPVGSTIASGNFVCQETIRDQGWGLFANGGSIVNANAAGSGLYLQELILKSCNNCVVSGVKFVNPDGGRNWHTMIADVSNFTADGNTFISGLGFGQDGLHIFGPYQDVEVLNTTLDTGDDGVVLDGGEYIGPGTILNINGAGHSASIDNTQGSDGSRCIAIYSLCVNASGSCVANLQSDIYIEGVTGLPGTEDGTQGCVQAVGLGVPNTASPALDNISIKNVTNNFNPQSATTNRPYVYVSPSGGVGSVAGLMGNLSVEIPGNLPTTDATGNDAAVTLDGLNQNLTVQNLTVNAPNFSGPGLLVSEVASTGAYTVDNYSTDNLTPALYSWVTAPTNTILTDSGITNGECPVWTSGTGLLTSSTTAQSTTVTVTVSGGAGNPTPTGSVSLNYGGLVLGSATLSSGSAQFTVQASSLSIGSDTLTANYTPDTNSSPTYSSGSGTGSVTVSTAPTLITPTVTVSPNPSSITTTESTTVTVTVSGGAGNPTPTGSVTLACGSTSLGTTTLNGGSAQFTVPASSLATGSNTLTFVYTVDASSFGAYNNASGTGSVTVTSPVTYILTVDSAAPSSGVTISASPADNNSRSSGTTPFPLTYNGGTRVTLTAALSAVVSGNSLSFVSWSGCTSTSGTSGSICSVTVDANTTVTAAYNQSGITSITVSPASAKIGTQQQFTATVNGTGSYSHAVTWTLSCPSCGSLSEGDFASTTSTTALYNTPYPAPATVTVTATSTQDTSISGSAIVTLNPPAAATGPTLAVDVNTPNNSSENPHTINPYVYGMNSYLLDTATEKTANFGIVRWGGDDTSRYNYQNGWTNSAADWYFENGNGAAFMFPNPTTGENFTQFFPAVDAAGAAALGTVPVNGWVSNGSYTCSFTQSEFPGQESYVNGCGNGIYADGSEGCTSSGGCDLYGSDTIAALTSIRETPPSIATAPAPGAVTTTWADATWSGAWVNSIVTGYGQGASGKGVAMWDLDNEPPWWDAVHRDVHPNPFTYDEVTNNGIGTALAIKTADPTALVSGPVIDYWWAYFYSKKDIENGWSSGNPCYEPWSNPTDRAAHGGVPLIEYYLRQFKSYSQLYNIRLLDYLDIHGYFAPDYPSGSGNSVAFTTAGDTEEQQARMNGTRVFWDPTYTDPNYPQPNYPTDPNYTTSCSPPLQAPQVIPMLASWVNSDYPGTQTAIDEYNFGGMEAINGAVVQADILGIFWPRGPGHERAVADGQQQRDRLGYTEPRELRLRDVPQLRRQRLHVWRHVSRCDQQGVWRRRGESVGRLCRPAKLRPGHHRDGHQ